MNGPFQIAGADAPINEVLVEVRVRVPAADLARHHDGGVVQHGAAAYSIESSFWIK